MKINIHKMQNGGGMPPFTYYKPVFVNNGRSRYLGQSDDIYGGGGHSSSSSSKSSSESSKGEITDKDLLLLLDKVDALPSDMKQLTKQLYKFYQLRDVGLADTSSLATEYIRAIQSLYTAKTNKELFDKVYDKAEKDNVLNEVAIDPSGRIQGILPDGTFTGVNVDELEDYEGFRPVTNLELMNIRSQLKPNDNSILNQVSNGISLQNINKMIKDYLNNLGTSESKTSGYEKRKAQTIEKGLEALQQAQDNGYTSESGLDGLYKVENLTKTQKDQAALAIDYIYDMLPDNAKELLKYHAYKRNEEPTEESAKSIIAKFVLSGTSTTKNHDETMVLDAEGKKLGSKSSSSGGSKVEEYADLFTNIIQGIGGSNSRYNFKDKDGNIASISGVNYPNLSLSPSNRIQNTSLQNFLDYGYNGITKGGNYAITFGDQVIDQLNMKDIACLSNRQAIRVILPTTVDRTTGKIVPDLEFMHNNQELINKINEKGLQDPEVIKELIQMGYIDQFSGQINLNKFQSYFCIDGLATNNTISVGQFVHRVPNNQLEVKRDEFLNAIYNKNSQQGKDYKYDYDNNTMLNPLDWFGNYDKLYEGTIYIPLTENSAQTKTAAGTKVKVSNQDDIQEYYDIGDFRRTNNFVTSSSNLLNN